ncbi:MAG TPA: hypothetical protein VMU31_05470 [Rhizomicrobium sp.]|nr:hypothetical protein [Rhizomicrobium sp.]
MRPFAIAALLSVALAGPCLADPGDQVSSPQPAMTVVDGSDASVPVGSTVVDGIDGQGAGALDDLPTIATHAPTPLIQASVLK